MRQLPFRNMRDVLGLHAKVAPHNTALIYYDSQDNRFDITYLEFVGKVHQVANFLYEDLGIKRHDCIAIASPNHENTLLLYFAAWVIGASVCALDTDTDDETLIHALNKKQITILFVADDVLDKYVTMTKNLSNLEGIVQIGGKQRADYLRFEDLAANRPTTFLGDESGAKGADIPLSDGDERTAQLSDTALITYEDGNAIERSQEDLIYNAHYLAEASTFTGNQTMLATMPLHRYFAESIMMPLLTGGTIVLTENFSVNNFWEQIVRERVHTTVLDMPELLRLRETAQKQLAAGKMRFGKQIIQQDVKHFRHILMFDRQMTKQTICDFEDTFGFPLMTGYRHPEHHELLTLLPITLAWKEHQHWLQAYDKPSIGTTFANCLLGIVNEYGEELGADEVGELAFYSVDEGWIPIGQRGFFAEDKHKQRFYFLS